MNCNIIYVILYLIVYYYYYLGEASNHQKKNDKQDEIGHKINIISFKFKHSTQKTGDACDIFILKIIFTKVLRRVNIDYIK